MKTYPHYKSSGIKWIGDVPEHWKCVKIGSRFTERRQKVSDKDYPPLSVAKIGIVPQLEDACKTDNGDNRKLVLVGDFVVNSRSDRKGSCGVSNLNGSVSLINIVLTPHNIAPSYIHYLFRSNDYIEEFYRNGRGIVADLWTTRYSEMKNITIPLPSANEQEAIVAFLDKATSKIDEYITAKEAEIEKLGTLKQVIISNAVTHGLNPDAPMKPSGIPWIGDVPEHWERKQLRNLLRFVSIRNKEHEQLLSVTREDGVIIRNVDSKEENHNFIPDDLSNYKFVTKGCFVINKMKSWQGSYAVSDFQGIVSPAYYVCKLDFDNKKFFSVAIRSKAYIPFISQYSKGIRVDQWDLSPIGLKTIPFFVPPLEEQEAIVEYIDRKIHEIDEYIGRIQEQIEKLKIYKQRLISDAVTGKIDVN